MATNIPKIHNLIFFKSLSGKTWKNCTYWLLTFGHFRKILYHLSRSAYVRGHHSWVDSSALCTLRSRVQISRTPSTLFHRQSIVLYLSLHWEKDENKENDTLRWPSQQKEARNCPFFKKKTINGAWMQIKCTLILARHKSSRWLLKTIQHFLHKNNCAKTIFLQILSNSIFCELECQSFELKSLRDTYFAFPNKILNEAIRSVYLLVNIYLYLYLRCAK